MTVYLVRVKVRASEVYRSRVKVRVGEVYRVRTVAYGEVYG